MNNLDRQITNLITNCVHEEDRMIFLKHDLVSQIKQSILKAIMKDKPKRDIPRLGSENQDEYVAYSHGFNSCLEYFESVIKEILTK